MLLLVLVKRLMLITFCSLLLTCTPVPHSQFRVLNTAPEQQTNRINVTNHLRTTPRPADNTQYPIALGDVGPIEPLYAGNNRYPFSCDTVRSGLGQPLVDNQQALGTAVFKENPDGSLSNTIIGYSKDCLVPSRLRYFVVNLNGESEEITNYSSLDKHQFDSNQQLIRLEQGIINRHIYTIAMPIKKTEFNTWRTSSLWNKKLIYQFAGGVGIGFRQGKVNPKKLLKRRFGQLHNGYAVITSSANKTSYTYNMLLAEDTAWRVKKQFEALYGKPIYTVGIGGSGGGLAQYLIAQNSPGLIDAAIPLYSYPDMVSQTIYALDCDLFNTYYHFKSDLANWDNSDKKRAIEGLNNAEIEHKSWFYTPINQFLTGKAFYRPKIYSECVHGYFGLSSLVNNPAQGFLKPLFSQTVNHQTNWSYWQDLALITQTPNAATSAPALWDNQGVQYGLNGLKQGSLSATEFLHLNYHIGGWKAQTEQRPEQLLFFPFVKTPIWLTQWSRHNIYVAGKKPAKRTVANLAAVRQAYRYGQVYLGFNSIPTIDIHHYLEDQLDMHHISTSFAARLRILKQQGHLKNHRIWIADKHYTPLNEAFSVIDKWLSTQQAPDDSSDRCFNKSGEIIAQGENVWHGDWNNQPAGACTKHFPIYTNSRIQAGGPFSGSIFKCQRIAVETAVANGVYAPIDMTPYLAELKRTFPDGVCDYDKPDLGNPFNVLSDKSGLPPLKSSQVAKSNGRS